MRRGTITGRPGLTAIPFGVFRVRKPGGKTYWYYQARRGKPDKGKPVRMPEFGTPEFRTEYARLTQQPGSSPRSLRYNVAALVGDYKAQPAWLALRPNTIAVYQAALGHILKAWAERSPKSITIAHVQALMRKNASRPGIANLILVLVKQLMKLAVQKGLRPDNPAREVDKLKERKDGAKPVSDAAWHALVSDAAPEVVRRLAILGRATGQRISDIVLMRPSDRDAEGITCTITKLRDRPHWCPLRPEEAAIIDAWDVPEGRAYIHGPRANKYGEDGLRMVWNDYAKSEAGRALNGYSPHDLRATKVCDERIRGRTHQQIAAMVGMSLPMVMKYSSRIDQRLAARGTPTIEQAAQATLGPLGTIHSLDEAAGYLRTTKHLLARVARHHGIGATFGRDLRFNDDDVRLLWEAVQCRSNSSGAKTAGTGTSAVQSEDKAFTNLRARAMKKLQSRSALNSKSAC